MKSFAAKFAIVLFVLIAISSTTYTVSETEQVIITRFGEPRGGVVARPGLHFKVPFTDDVNRFDKRWLEWDGDANQIPTRDKKYIWVDTYSRWRITNPLRFFQRFRTEQAAQSRLDDIIDGETRNVVAQHDLLEIVRSTNRRFDKGDEPEDVIAEEAAAEVHMGRDQITRQVLERASKIVPDYGIELVDVQVKRVNYVDSVQGKVFERMISERQRIAERYRSEGQGKSAEIRGKKERELRQIASEAYKKAEEIRGRADAEAAVIYAGAYNKNPELYQFVESLRTYRDTVDPKTWLVLSTDSELFKYLPGPRDGR